MKKGLVYAAVTRKSVTLFSAIVILVFGIYSYYHIPKQEYPDIPAPAAMITAAYPGASSAEVEEIVTRRIEEKIMELEDYDYSLSTSQSGLASVLLVLDMDMTERDIDKAWMDLRQKMDEVKQGLPAGAGDILIDTNLVETAGMLVSLSGEGMDCEQLVSYGEKLKSELMRADGVRRVDILGEQKREVRIEVDTAKLSGLGISLDDVTKVLAAQNSLIPSGNIKDEGFSIGVRPSGLFGSIEETGDVIIAFSRDTGAIVRLKDVAKIGMEPEDSNYKVRKDGKEAILLAGYFKQDQNVVHTGKKVDDVLHAFGKGVPRELKIEKLTYQPNDVAKSVGDFTVNLIQGVVIVVIVVFLGMGIRNSAIVFLAIPLSILATVSVMGVMGIGMHMITITGLIMALGMLVDNAIVVSDAIQVRMDAGEEKLSACVGGAREVAVPVLSSTLTTMAAFTPLLFLPEASGKFAEGIPLMVIISLAASYIAAMLVIPMLAHIFFTKSRGNKKESIIRIHYEKLLAFGLQRKGITITVAVVLFILAILLAGLIPQQMYPTSAKNMIYIDIRTEAASDITRTEQVTKKVEAVLAEQPEIRAFLSAVGGGLPKFDLSIVPKANSPDTAQIMVLVDLERGKRFANNGQLAGYIQDIVDQAIVGARVTVNELTLVGLGDPVQVRVLGDDMDRLKEASERIRGELSMIEGTTNIKDDMHVLEYELLVDVDSSRASVLGFTKYDIQNEINIALMGRRASVLRKDGKEYAILVKGDITSKDRLENLVVKSPATGTKVPLKSLAKVTLTERLPAINRYDGERAVAVSCGVRPGYNAIEIQTMLEKRLEAMDFPGVWLVYEGEKKDLESDTGNIGIAAVFAIFLIFVILMIQFNSVLQPVIVLLTVPLSMIGSVISLLVFGQPLSLFGILGIASLIGVVVNNAILLIDYINQERRNGKPVDEACRGAVKARLRPVILTTVTTVLGLIPLAFSGNDLFVPMAVSFMGGLTVSTLLTLVIIPVVYSIVEGRIDRIKKVSNQFLIKT